MQDKNDRRVECDACPRSIGCNTSCMKAVTPPNDPAPDAGGYVNVHGKPVLVDFRALVWNELPKACVQERKHGLNTGEQDPPRTHYRVREDDDQLSCVIGAGASPEAAWRDAYFRLLEREPALDDGEDNSDYQ